MKIRIEMLPVNTSLQTAAAIHNHLAPHFKEVRYGRHHDNGLPTIIVESAGINADAMAAIGTLFTDGLIYWMEVLNETFLNSKK